MLWKQKVPRLIRGQVNMSQRLKFLLFYSDVVAMAVHSAVYINVQLPHYTILPMDPHHLI